MSLVDKMEEVEVGKGKDITEKKISDMTREELVIVGNKKREETKKVRGKASVLIATAGTSIISGIILLLLLDTMIPFIPIGIGVIILILGISKEFACCKIVENIRDIRKRIKQIDESAVINIREAGKGAEMGYSVKEAEKAKKMQEELQRSTEEAGKKIQDMKQTEEDLEKTKKRVNIGNALSDIIPVLTKGGAILGLLIGALFAIRLAISAIPISAIPGTTSLPISTNLLIFIGIIGVILIIAWIVKSFFFPNAIQNTEKVRWISWYINKITRSNRYSGRGPNGWYYINGRVIEEELIL